MKKQKYYVHYVHDCTPRIRAFNSAKSAMKFYDSINYNNKDNDQYAEFVIKGQLVAADSYYKGTLKEKVKI